MFIRLTRQRLTARALYQSPFSKKWDMTGLKEEAFSMSCLTDFQMKEYECDVLCDLELVVSVLEEQQELI